jgi:hypothetical protein
LIIEGHQNIANKLKDKRVENANVARENLQAMEAVHEAEDAAKRRMQD